MTTSGEHHLARLLLEERVIGISSAADDRWLSEHLAACSECSEAETRLREAILLLRSEPVMAPSFLVGRTRTSVRVRARELQENAARTRMLLLSLGLALVWTVLSAYAAYAAYNSWAPEWDLGLSKNAIAWGVGFAWFWFAPALFILVLLTRGNGESLRTVTGMNERELGHE